MKNNQSTAATDMHAETSDVLCALREMVAHADIGIINQPALRRAHAALEKVSTTPSLPPALNADRGRSMTG